MEGKLNSPLPVELAFLRILMYDDGMNTYKEAIVAANELTKVLEIYGSIGYDESSYFTGMALRALATANDVSDALRDIKEEFVSRIDLLESYRGEWLNQEAPKTVAAALAYAESDAIAFPVLP